MDKIDRIETPALATLSFIGNIMNILLTGFSGTLGTTVARSLLENGNKLRVLLHSAAIDPQDINPELEIFWGSLSHHHLFDQLTRDIDVVVHCAWESRGVSDGMLEKANLDGTISLIEAAECNKVKTFIHISSVGVYGLDRLLWGKVLNEEHSLVSKEESLHFYPWTKVLIEKKCQELQSKLEMNLVVIRPGLLFNDTKGPAKRVISSKNKQYGLLVGRGQNHLPYIHVDDVAEMILKIIGKPPKYRVYNCVPTTQLPAHEFLKNWGQRNGHTVKVLRIPPVFFRMMNWLAQKLKSALGRESRGSSVDYQILTGIRDIRYSAERAVQELGWQDKQTMFIVMKSKP